MINSHSKLFPYRGFLQILFVIAFSLNLKNTSAQISPPGLGSGHTASWLALGLRQELDPYQKWQSMTYIGLGRKSNPDNFNPLQKSGILVLNQEFYYKTKSHWKFSGAISYRNQDEYVSYAPYEHKVPSKKKEIRIYSRAAYEIKNRFFKITPTLRQEFRSFNIPQNDKWLDALQWRTRLRLKASIYLDAQKTHTIILSNEQLFATDKKLNVQASWSPMAYKESRFALYYSYSPEHIPIILSIGYMNDLIGAKHPYSLNYLAVDLVFENIFGWHENAKDELNENFE